MRGGNEGGRIVTPGVQIRTTQLSGHSDPFLFELQIGQSQVSRYISFGLTKLEWAATVIAGQIAGEYAGGMREVVARHDIDFDDAKYIEGVAGLACDLAEAVLAECQERQREKIREQAEAAKEAKESGHGNGDGEGDREREGGDQGGPKLVLPPDSDG